MLNCAFAVGGVIGPGFAGALVAQAGWTALCLVMGAMNAICVVLVVSCTTLDLDLKRLF